LRPALHKKKAFLWLIDPNQPEARNRVVVAMIEHRALIDHLFKLFFERHCDFPNPPNMVGDVEARSHPSAVGTAARAPG
jgi:hypothetical protein